MLSSQLSPSSKQSSLERSHSGALLERSRSVALNHHPCSASRLLLWTLRISSILAASLFGLTLYFWVGFNVYNWGSSQLQQVMTAPILFLLMYSIWMWCSNLLGFSALKYFFNPALATNIKANNILRLFLAFLMLTALFELASIIYTYTFLSSFKEPSGDFSDLETLIANIFNTLFFDNARGSFSGNFFTS